MDARGWGENSKENEKKKRFGRLPTAISRVVVAAGNIFWSLRLDLPHACVCIQCIKRRSLRDAYSALEGSRAVHVSE